MDLTSCIGHYTSSRHFPQGRRALQGPSGVCCKSSWRQNTLSHCWLKGSLSWRKRAESYVSHFIADANAVPLLLFSLFLFSENPD